MTGCFCPEPTPEQWQWNACSSDTKAITEKRKKKKKEHKLEITSNLEVIGHGDGKIDIRLDALN